MISRLHRFHGQKALANVYKNGKTVRGTFQSIKYAPNNRSTYRVAVVVSRKVNKSAVVRNRIRRRLYEIVRREEDQMLKPADIIVTVFDDKVAAMPAPDLQKTMQAQLAQSGLIQNRPNSDRSPAV
jgi:ribonuclease P protein component